MAYIDLTDYDGPTLADAGTRRTITHLHDAKAAVRFFRKDAATKDRYGIDPGKIVLGGHSAKGAISGITAYLDPTKADSDFQRLLAAAGGPDGASGNAGYDSSVAGWISLAGCMRIADLHWITSASPPMLVVYGTKDEAIPPGTGTITLLGERTTWGGALPLRPGEVRGTHRVTDLCDQGR